MDIDIKSLITKGEHSQVESKKTARGIPDSLWESYSAFANTSGGVILLGVSELAGKLEITDVSESAKKIKNIWDILNDKKKINVNILFERNVFVHKENDKEIIVIKVPRADRHDKPVFINNDLMNGTFRRNAEGDYHCSLSEIKSMLRDQSDIPIDGVVFDEITFDDLDKDTVKRYRNMFSVLKPEHIWNRLDDIAFLHKIGALGRAETSELKPTLAGLVMFADEDVITRILPDYFLDFREKYDNDRWSDRVVSNLGEWSGNIFDFFFKIANRLTADIKRPFQMRDNIYREDDTSIHKALREALANALIHADYYGRRGIVIEKKKHLITFENPGSFRPDIAEVMNGGITDPRNPNIFKMFALLDIGERAGSGLHTIHTIWQDAGWDLPVLSEQIEPARTMLLVPIEIENNEGINAESEGINSKDEGINALVRTITLYPGNRAVFLGDKLQIPVKTIERWLKKLKDENQIEFQGSKKTGGYWKIIKQQ
ncbi:MAG: putative DNA binding domain-containing protein [Tannerella sp.]|jgi:predicted HTH transcriptional regulator|nr:putative DNA binding domain-containing protein [Tannerella sp.]